MSNQIAVDRFTTELFDVLDEMFEHHHGIFLDKGTSLFETLAGVSAQEASRAASPKSATVAAHVKHICFYLNVLEDHILNRNIGKIDWGEIWRNTTEVAPEEWERLTGQLRQTYRRVLTTMKSLEWQGENDISGVLAIVAHTAYHLGGIRQALQVIR